MPILAAARAVVLQAKLFRHRVDNFPFRQGKVRRKNHILQQNGVGEKELAQLLRPVRHEALVVRAFAETQAGMAVGQIVAHRGGAGGNGVQNSVFFEAQSFSFAPAAFSHHAIAETGVVARFRGDGIGDLRDDLVDNGSA